MIRYSIYGQLSCVINWFCMPYVCANQNHQDECLYSVNPGHIPENTGQVQVKNILYKHIMIQPR